MKIIFSICIFGLLFISVKAQMPPIGIIDFYGLQTLSDSQVRTALLLKEGDSLPDSKAEIEKRLKSLPDIEEVSLNVVCCDSGKMILFVGIREKGTPFLKFRPDPKSKILLPDEIIKTHHSYLEALSKAVLKGDVENDASQGHSLSKNAEVRAFQEKFIALANQNIKLLRRVIYESSNAEHRSVAVQVIAYYKDKKEIVKKLVYAINDADGTVRNDAMRALGVIAQYGLENPSKNIKVPFEPFVEMLNSLEWTDRNKSSIALLRLTEKRDKILLAKLKKNTLNSLIEMARWKSRGHAFAAFGILARIVGIPEEEIEKMWNNGKGEDVIEKVKQN
jgi:hypothetical protein